MTDPKPSTQEAKLAGKVAITGGASGIGEAMAHLFAAYSARAVVIADIQDEKGRGVAEAIGLTRSVYIHCDVSDEHEVEALVKSTVGIYGRIDVMFSNAGILSRSLQKVLDLDMGSMDRRSRRTATWTTRCEARASGSGEVRERGAWRLRHTRQQRVAVACGDAADAGIFWDLGDDEVAERVFEEYMSLKGVSCKMRDVTEAVAFLASDESELITGHDLVVDGGSRRPRYKEQSQKLP